MNDLNFASSRLRVSDLLEQHFDTAFAAPDGIKKLRELILTLAMQGRLVEQVRSDPPASQLLKEIEAEKKRLVKEGKIKAPKLLPEIKPEEVPYKLPQRWEWVRFPDCYYGIGNRANQIQTNGYLESGAYPVIDQGKAFIAAYTNEKDILLKLEKPVIVFGDHTKNIKYVDFDFVIGADGVKTLCPYDGIAPRFLFRLMQSYRLTDRGYARHFGVLNEKFTPLPPLPEQPRIVAKIDQLMARCDELEKLRAEREQKRRSVHAAALKQLLDASTSSFPRRRESSASKKLDSRLRGNDGSFDDAWQFITQHFGELYAVRENVTELRKAILQLAVMGKLVPQNPNDPPASQLLKEIEAEKKRLVKEGKIKAPKPLPEIKPEDVPYALPQGWEWTMLAEVGLINPRNVAQDSTSVSFVPMTLIGKNLNGSHEQEERIWADVKQGFTHFAEGDIGVAKITPCFENSKACVFYNLKNGLGAGTTELHIVRPVGEKIASRFVLAYLKSPRFLRIGEAKMTGTAGQKRLPKEFIETNPFPLPPLQEQHRIVAKIDSLMSLCDTLEQQIDAAARQQTTLLDAVMAQV